MRQFQYKYGDRPLEGYTIERGAGFGGFGEVYYAVSDSGRQVALKAIQNYEQIELRGITQCMNLKSPHLVSIFDVKYNEDHKPFVIMEYVSGPSLSDIIKDSPGGLGTQKTAFFLREIAKGLSYLHECGIVHRDLKPSNIFYENGAVKIGDYGLSKAINSNCNSAQTITVGTVHYMAPEIGAGRYDRSVDIYALGILLYEMITGQLPFFGASPAEVLMKHMTADAELENIEQPFRRVIKKALCKDPAERYQTVQEMVEDVFGSEQVQNSMSHFSPNSLSMVAERIGKKMGHELPRRKDPIAERAEYVKKTVNTRFAQAQSRMNNIGRYWVDAEDTDSVSRGQRSFLFFLTAFLAAMAGSAFGAYDGITKLLIIMLTWVAVSASASIILLCRRVLLARMEDEPGFTRRALMSLAASLPLIGIVMLAAMAGFGPFERGNPALIFIYIGMYCVDWWQLSSPDRDQRISLGSALWVGFIGWITGHISGLSPEVLACIFAGTAFAVQVLSPFAPNASRPQPQPKQKPEPKPQPQTAYTPNTTQADSFPTHSQPSAIPQTQYSQSNAFASSYYKSSSSPFASLLAGLGYVLLFIALILGTAAALRLQVIIEGAIPEAAADLKRELGEGWPVILNMILFLGAVITGALAASAIIIVRRRHGIWHMIRSITAMAGFVFALLITYDAFYRSFTVESLQKVFTGNSERLFEGRVDLDNFITAALIFVVSVVLLAWPKKSPNKYLMSSKYMEN